MQEAGIPSDFFLKHTNLLKDKHETVQHAILQSIGIHTQNKKTPRIRWIQFMQLYTLLQYASATKAQYVDFWTRFMNPGADKFVRREDFEHRMELLARGSFTDKETLISINYARGLYQVLASLNCLSKDEKQLGMINMGKVKKRLVSGALHTEYLNQTLKKDCEFILDEEMMADGEAKIRKMMPKQDSEDGGDAGMGSGLAQKIQLI